MQSSFFFSLGRWCAAQPLSVGTWSGRNIASCGIALLVRHRHRHRARQKLLVLGRGAVFPRAARGRPAPMIRWQSCVFLLAFAQWWGVERHALDERRPCKREWRVAASRNVATLEIPRGASRGRTRAQISAPNSRCCVYSTPTPAVVPKAAWERHSRNPLAPLGGGNCFEGRRIQLSVFALEPSCRLDTCRDHPGARLSAMS